ncbi:protein translocase subunit SecDF [Bacteroidia bacterium]|nr:protein translocase subunit SecDF [Bacteroidia bacterium]
MQNKLVIKIFTILFALICLYQLSFTAVTTIVENKAKKYSNNEMVAETAKLSAAGDEQREKFLFDSLTSNRNQYFLDSVANQVVYNIGIRKYTYKECKEREINLGLDLRGGMNVMMEVSTSDVVKALSSFSDDPFFYEVMEKAIAEHKITPNSNFVDIFAKVWNAQDANAQMAAIFSYEMKSIDATSSNADVVKALKVETAGAFDRTYQILRQRIDKFGVAQPNIQKLTQTERILIELPGVKEPERVRKLLSGTAQLEFWETYEFSEIYPYLDEANKFLLSVNAVKAVAEDVAPANTADASPEKNSLLDQIAADTNSSAEENSDAEKWRAENPLFAVLIPVLGQGDENRVGPVAGYVQQKDITKVNQLLETAKTKFPRNIKWVWSVKPISPETDLYQLIALRISTRDGRAPLTGEVVTDARQDYDQRGGVDISMSMNAEGAKEWKKLTGSNIGKAIAIVLDNYAYSWPKVNGEIPGGRSSITGGFSLEEGKDLANVLKAGKLPAPAKIVQEAVVGPSLGQQAINSGMFSFLLAFIMVLVYMLFFYNRAGLAANVALLVNVFFLIGVLASLGAVLTLPGIAGIVLTMGMAVDANVIIYERIKEEIRLGKGLKLAVSDGYKAAYSAIIDGQVTTLLTGIVLYIFGTGPIQGFATTLCIGILTSVFTSIFISRLIFERSLSKNKKIAFDNKIVRNFLRNTNWNIIGARKISYIVSIALVVIAIVSLSTKGLNLGIDFTGGRTYVVRFDQNVNVQDARTALAEEFDGLAPEVKTYGPNTQIKISTKYLVDESGADVEKAIDAKLYEGLKSFYNESISLDEFSNESEGKMLGKLSSEMIGPTMATDITRSAFIAVFIALFAIFIYIAIRFKRWQFGVGGVIGLAHDALVTIGAFSLLSGILPFTMEIDQAFIAAILTVIGYSINDTVIIFDRIRENIKLYPKHSIDLQVNMAFNSTLARTFNTSMTTLVTLIMIFCLGGEVIRGFIFALMFGILLGTYSSMFVAGPVARDLLVWGSKRKERKVAKKA